MNQEIYDKLHAFRMEHFNSLYTENAEFKEYAMKVYEYCCAMKPGTCINLTRYSGQKLDWTLLTIAAFYNSGANHIEYYVSEDYTRFVRKKFDPKELQRRIDDYLDLRYPREKKSNKAT